jgi:carbon storage regulator CsrA
MLVITRRVGEQIVIGDAIRLTIVAITGDRARIDRTGPATVALDAFFVA